MHGPSKILIVGDDALASVSVIRNWGNEFSINEFSMEASTEHAGLPEALRQIQPDILILDIALPNKNGYELCDELKQCKNTQQIPVIFHSTNNSIRERMLGYEVGAVDYIYKDCDEQEMRAKLHAIARQARQTAALKENIDRAEKTALEALTTNFELGKAVRYVEKSYSASDFQSLSELLADFFNDLKLSAVLLFHTHEGHRFYSTNSNPVSPIESELMLKLHNSERFIDFGFRTLVNYPRIAVLIKNMPIDNREHYGRLKDTLPFVLGASDAKIRMLDAELAVSAQCASLTTSVETAQLTLSMVKESFQNNLENVTKVMSELISKLTVDITRMHLDERDEERILSTIEHTSKKLHLILAENHQTDFVLNELVKLLTQLSVEQNKIIAETLQTKGDKEDYQSDVELF